MRMLKRAIKAFQNLQLTEHHIDSLQQSAAGAGGDERGCGGERGGQAELAHRRSSAMLRHRTAYLPRPYHWANRLLLPVRAAQLSAASSVGGPPVDVQRALLGRRGRHRSRHGGLLPRAGRRPTTVLHEYS